MGSDEWKIFCSKILHETDNENFPPINNYDMLGVWNVSDIYTGSVKRKNK